MDKADHQNTGAYLKTLQQMFQGSEHEKPLTVLLTMVNDIIKDKVAPEDVFEIYRRLGEGFYMLAIGDRAENLELMIAYLKKALAQLGLKPVIENWVMTMNSLGIAYANRIKEDRAENIELAIEHYKHALSVYKKDVVPLKWAMTMNNLGIAYSDRIKEDRAENIELAIEHYKHALSVFKKDVVPLDWATAKFNLGKALWQQSILTEDKHLQNRAFSTLQQALGEICRIYTEIIDLNARKNFLKQEKGSFYFVINTLLGKQRYSEVLYWLEKIRSQTLLEDINLESLRPEKSEAARLAEKYWNFCHKVRQLRALLTEKVDTRAGDVFLSSEPRGSITPGTRRSFHKSVTKRNTQFLKKNIKEKNHTFEKLHALDPDYGDLIAAKPLSEMELRHLLSETQSAGALMYYNRQEGGIDFLVCYPSQTEICYKHLKMDIPQSLLDVLRDFLNSYSSGLFNHSHVSDLVREAGALMQPVADLLEDLKIHRLFLSSHYFLQAIPFHAALLPKSGKYFLENVQVCYTPSLSLSYRLFCSQSNTSHKAISVFYAPKERPLKHGNKEFDNILELYGVDNVIALKDNVATLENLIARHSEIKDICGLINFTCHGGSDSFAGDAYLDLDNGRVFSANLIEHLNLSGLPLVVLAACETGKSDDSMEEYEEYRALDSAFLQMEAKSVVSTLYSVDDLSTYHVLQRFHRDVKAGFPACKALHQAQIDSIQGTVSIPEYGTSRGRKTKQDPIKKNDFSHPFFWAFLKYSGTF